MDSSEAIAAVWRTEAPRIIAALTRLTQDVGLAEDLAHDALVAAMEQWPAAGIPEPTVAQRIVRAKKTLLAARAPFELPPRGELVQRLDSVLEVISLVFNEGHSATTGEDWMRIVGLYSELAQRHPSPVVDLNRAVALGMLLGPESGLRLVDALAEEGALAGYHLLPAVRADFLHRLSRLDEARAELLRAARLTRNQRERALLERRAAALE